MSNLNPTLAKAVRGIAALLFLLPTALQAATPSCGLPAQPIEFSHQSWGIDNSNTRYQPRSQIRPDNVQRLQLAWAFALDSQSPHSYPLLSADTLFIGDADGSLYALDRNTGCQRWRFAADDEIRSAVVPGRITRARGEAVDALFFGTREGTAYAVNAANGELLWQIEADPHPFALVTGTPLFHDNVLYIPVSSYEVIIAAMPFYGCCTFRGSLLAVDAVDGSELWRTYTVEQEPRPLTDNWLLPDKKGPSGVPVWSAPTLDTERGLLLFGSGENYSDPPTSGSDAITALDMRSGKQVWQRQFTEGDAWNAGCNSWFDSNCPEANGPDLDFGAPPILFGDRVFAGQKSAGVFAMNARDGALIWEQRLGRGGMLGGIHWGMALHPASRLLVVPISDRATGPDQNKPQPGLFALDLADGELRWRYDNLGTCTEAKENCHEGMSAAVILNDSLVFAGGLDGWLHAFDLQQGNKLWSADTWRSFDSVNGKPAAGGAIDVHGPLILDDLLIVSSGYEGFGQGGGNTLLVYRLTPL